MSLYILMGFGLMMTFDLLLIPQNVQMGFAARVILILTWPIFAMALLSSIFRP